MGNLNNAVTSANGSLGTAIIKRILQENGRDHVVGIARTPEKAKHLGIEIRKGDFNMREEFYHALSGIYEGISKDLFTAASDYESAAGRPHLNAWEMIKQFQTSQNGTKS